MNRGPLDLQSNALPLSYTPLAQHLHKDISKTFTERDKFLCPLARLLYLAAPFAPYSDCQRLYREFNYDKYHYYRESTTEASPRRQRVLTPCITLAVYQVRASVPCIMELGNQPALVQHKLTRSQKSSPSSFCEKSWQKGGGRRGKEGAPGVEPGTS